MELDKTKKVEELANKILADCEKEVKILTDQIEKKSLAIEEAYWKMNEATLSGDDKAFREAKATVRDLKDDRELHQIRLERLNDKPLVSKEDYEKAVNEIYSEFEAVKEQKTQQLKELSEQMEEISDELSEALEEANGVLAHFQDKVYRGADRSRNAKGEYLHLYSENKIVKDDGLIDWGKAAVRKYQYEKLTGRKVE